MIGVKTKVEETMVIETDGKEMSASEASARRELNVANEGNVAIVKIVREGIGEIEKGDVSTLVFNFGLRRAFL